MDEIKAIKDETETTLAKQRELFSLHDQRIAELYAYRDNFYIQNANSSSSSDRNTCLLAKLTALVEELAHLGVTSFESKAKYLLLIGKAWNVLPEYEARAFDALSRSIKLDPKSTDAWNAMGECYWKKRDFDMCRNCFEHSLQIERDKRSLRSMSMVMRQLINMPPSSNGKDQQQQQLKQQRQQQQRQQQRQQPRQESQLAKFKQVKYLLDESLRYAKEAIQLDSSDGMSWYILANCYVAMFFLPYSPKNPLHLKQANSAYQLAIKNEPTTSSSAAAAAAAAGSYQSDLYFNKSMISMYEENWSDALLCLCNALNLDPWWNEVRENLHGTLRYLLQISELIANKGKIKPKKLQKLVESVGSIDISPYTYRQKSSQNEAAECAELSKATLQELTKGWNRNKMFVGRVICGLPTKQSDHLNIVCFTCCLVDAAGDAVALTIYNLAGGKGVIIGDWIAIPEPFVERVDFRFDLAEHLNNKILTHEICESLKAILSNDATTPQSNNENVASESKSTSFAFNFSSIRVEEPTILIVNGRKWTKDSVFCPTFFVPKIISD